ncbi:hypothetical protein L596_021856 [Steinernema carpocapsae]|uniref:Uncharacterized protein n=1 Tax=Steinernema carpocapsae TaxID=34508 RepID=A0A4U5MKC5_STECR|nr:hypothetical protein L596_021856 [Steinernema carpocapsae]
MTTNDLQMSTRKMSRNCPKRKEDLCHSMIQCENGTIAVTRVAGMLLALKANNSVPLGMLKAKLVALANHLEPALSMISRDSKF